MSTLLEDIKPLVTTTLPFLRIGECTMHNTNGDYDVDGIYLEHKSAAAFPRGFVNTITLAIDKGWMFIGLHCNGTDKVKTLRRSMDKLELNDLLLLIHTAWVGEDEVS